jgi:apolipoprotein N-acyltransferase
MKLSLVRIASAIWVIGIVLTIFGSLSVPPADLPLYIGLACVTLVPLIFGSRRYRVFGAIALAVSLLMVVLECWAGIRIKEQREHNRRTIVEENQQTNAAATEQQKP